jgi:hypothetical protein
MVNARGDARKTIQSVWRETLGEIKLRPQPVPRFILLPKCPSKENTIGVKASPKQRRSHRERGCALSVRSS